MSWDADTLIRKSISETLDDDTLLDNIGDEILALLYDEPTCDFEHAWNCGINAAHDCLNGYGDEE